MAHLVYHIGDEQSMAFVGQTPWHGLGQELDPNSPLEVWEKKAHLDWFVAESPVKFEIPGGFRDAMIPADMDNRKVLYRTDNNAPLSIVGTGYKVVQPIEILEFYRDLIHHHNFQMETAGSLDDGRRVWALARMGDGFTLPGNDEIRPYCLLMTSYDTSLATTLMFTSVRVVCNNTLEWAYGEGENAASTIKIPHYDTFDPAAVKLEAGLIDGSWYKYSKVCADMVRYTMPSVEAHDFFAKLIFDAEALRTLPWDSLPAAQLKAHADIVKGYLEGRGAEIKAAYGTLWGALNAVTEYVDHNKPAYNTNNRFKATISGAGRQLKLKAWKLANRLLGKRENDELEEMSEELRDMNS